MHVRWVLALSCILLLTIAGASVARIRVPVAAGLFYPAEADKLLAATQQYVDEAQVPELPGRYVACVVPHSAYPFCGQVAAHAFKPLKRGQYDRVIVLGSSHFAEFRGCSIPSVEVYRTPLGDVPLDLRAREKLQWNTLIDIRSVTRNPAKHFNDGSNRTPLHEVEYSVELVLPFLQLQLGRFKLLPIVVGDFLDYQGEPDHAAIDSVVESLRQIMDDRTLIVASTDFTHFGNAYGFRPFEADFAERIGELDVEAFEHVLRRDSIGFETYMNDSDNVICGENVLKILMRLLPKGTRGVLLDYKISGEITGSFETSVSYASLAFYNPLEAPAEVHAQPPPVLPPPSAPAPVLAPSEKVEGAAAAPAAPVERPAAPEDAVKKEDEQTPDKKGLSRLFQKREKKTER